MAEDMDMGNCPAQMPLDRSNSPSRSLSCTSKLNLIFKNKDKEEERAANRQPDFSFKDYTGEDMDMGHRPKPDRSQIQLQPFFQLSLRKL